MRPTLLLDAGNSRLKARIVYPDTATVIAQTAIDNHKWPMLITWLQQHPGIQQAYAVIVTHADWFNVVSDALATLGITVQHLAVQASTAGLSNDYAPRQLGTDRWYGVLGAYAQHQAPHFVAVSFGTATTVDVVHHRRYRGGLILPGVQMMFDSMAMGTARLPTLSAPQPGLQTPFPTHTQAAMAHGVHCAQLGAVWSQYWALQQQIEGETPPLYIAGGHADNMRALWATSPWPGLTSPAPAVYAIDYPVLDGMMLAVNAVASAASS